MAGGCIAAAVLDLRTQIRYVRCREQVLPAAGGASGVAESIVEYADGIGADVVVIGSRGMGAVKR